MKEHPGLRRFFIILAVLVIIGFAGFVWCLFYLPVSLDVSIMKESFYEGDTVRPSDLQVDVLSASGRVLKSNEAVVVEPTADLSSVMVSSGGLRAEVVLPMVKVKELKAIYDGKLYAGQRPDLEKLSVTAVFEDGTERPVRNISFDTDVIPMADTTDVKYPFVIKTECGDTTLLMDVELPVQMEASCGDVIVGTAFDKALIDVVLRYGDDTEYSLMTFDVKDAPEYFTEDTDLTIDSEYGSTVLTVHPMAVENLRAEYSATVYEGDRLSRDNIHVYVTLQGQFEKETDDYEFVDPGPIKMKIHVPFSTRYGETSFDVTPVKMDTCSFNVGGEIAEGSPAVIDSVNMAYEDGREETVPADSCVFLNLPETWHSGTNDVWFAYNNMEYHSSVDGIPESVVSSRRDDLGDLTVFEKYFLSEEDIRFLAVIAQRIGAHDMESLVAELSLIANRYELSGFTGSIVEYVHANGYWGEDLDSYVATYEPYDDALYAVRDVFVNGHRALPAYVDEHVNTSVVLSLSNDSYVPDETEVTTTDGRVVRYCYVAPGNTSMIYCYTNDAYQQIMGVMPPAPVYPSPVIEEPVFDDGIVIEDWDG